MTSAGPDANRLGRPRPRGLVAPRRPGLLYLFFGCTSIAALVVSLLFVQALGPPATPVSAGTPLPISPSMDVVVPWNVSVSYMGYVHGYFGPTSLPSCGEPGPCPSLPDGHESVQPESEFEWNLSLVNHDPSSAHWIDAVSVAVPFELEAIVPDAPVGVCAGCTGPEITLVLLSPEDVGTYTLVVSVTTLD